MLKHHLRLALRTLFRHPGYTALNVLGLAAGIACALLIALYVRHELRYDRFHHDADRVYRLHVGHDQVVTPSIVAPLLARSLPEVEAAARLYDVGSFRSMLVRYEDVVHEESRFFYADSTVFGVLTLPLVAGDPARALVRPRTVVLSRTLARKYFGDADPVGKTLTVGSGTPFEVTGVMEDLPSASHLAIDLMASFATLRTADQEVWHSANYLTYVRLSPEADRAVFERKVSGLVAEARQGGHVRPDYRLTMVPITDLYLRFEGRVAYVYLFTAIGLLILLVACINYMNLATARAARRAREVGMRKVLGAYRGQLAGQFYGEAALTTLGALGLAVLLAYLSLPVFNAVSGRELTLRLFDDPLLVGMLVVVPVVVALVAGSYPALMLSSFRPLAVLKGGAARIGGGTLRRVLVTVQFAVSVFLLAGTAVIYAQLAYVRSMHPGFDKEQVLVLPLGDQTLQEQYGTLKDELARLVGVRGAAAVNSIPGYQRGGYLLEAEGLVLADGEVFGIRGVQAEPGVVETLGLELVSGTVFRVPDGYTTAQGYVYLINETAARQLGWTPAEAVGKRFNLLGNRPGRVVGVVRDFHHSSLHEPIDPLALFVEPGSYEHLLVRLEPRDVAATLAAIEQAWVRTAPHRPFEYRFLDAAFDALYQAEERLGRLTGLFAMLAVFIACLGLVGLAAYSAEQRTKEIGIRKVLGASVPGVVGLLSKEYTRLVMVAFVLAAPVAYLVAQRWLDRFAYPVDIPWWLFTAAGGVVLAFAFVTVSAHAIRAAMTNPVEALRYE